MSKIDIDPKNKGKFTATQKRTGKTTSELCHSKNKLTAKRANFARMAKRGWKPLKEEVLENIIKESIRRVVKKVIKENMYNDQWEEEIKIFFKGLENGRAIVDDGYVAVELGHSDNDPRYIYYKEGDDCLTDDHFSMQHSRRLYWDEISWLRDCTKRMYGVDIYIPDDEYYDEVYGFEE